MSPKNKLSFCTWCVMLKCKQAPYQNLGVKPTKPKEAFGADVTGPHQTIIIRFKYCLEVECFKTFQAVDTPICFERRVMMFKSLMI